METKYLGSSYYVSVTCWNKQMRVDIRNYDQSTDFEGATKLIPTKKGVSLTTDQWIKLKESLPAIEAAVNSGEERLISLGNTTFMEVNPQSAYIDIRHYWYPEQSSIPEHVPEETDEPKPTRRGVHLSVAHFTALIELKDEIDQALTANLNHKVLRGSEWCASWKKFQETVKKQNESNS